MKALNFSDIILKHSKSIVSSRSECDITCKFGNNVFAAPVCCSNMKSVLTPQICRIFDERRWFYVYHRINGIEDVEKFVWDANCKKSSRWSYDGTKEFNTISISVGIGDEWCYLINRLSVENLRVDYFTVDVALSYNDNIIPIVQTIKKKFPSSYLIVGNGSDPSWIIWLERMGVNCAKVGIGVSKACFDGNTLISTIDGMIPIKDIQIGDKVLTHTSTYQSVIDKMTKYDTDLFDVNGHICTANHKFYVVKIQDVDKITDDNIHEYAIWIEASKLNNDYLLVEID